jgi:uncharacterized oligopeptide transporter (OPT) family protein
LFSYDKFYVLASFIHMSSYLKLFSYCFYRFEFNHSHLLFIFIHSSISRISYVVIKLFYLINQIKLCLVGKTEEVVRMEWNQITKVLKTKNEYVKRYLSFLSIICFYLYLPIVPWNLYIYNEVYTYHTVSLIYGIIVIVVFFGFYDISSYI